MTIPASVSTGISALLAGVTAAYPLANASIFTLAGLQAQAASLNVTLDNALLADDSQVAVPAFSDPQTFADQFMTLVALCAEETQIAQLRALCGRAALNLSNAGA